LSSYCDLTVQNVELLWNQGDVIGIEFFRPCDKIVTPAKSEDEYTLCKYSAPVSVVIDRLKAMGFVAEDAKKGQEAYIQELEESYLRLNSEPSSEVINLIKNFSFESWQRNIRKMLDNKDQKTSLGFDPVFELKSESDILFNSYVEQSYFGNNASWNSVILAILELVENKEKTKVTLDYSELVSGGYFDESDELCREGSFEKTVLLTEGISDKRFIQRSLKVLYPHLYDYYSFLDFKELKLKGSASSLVHTVKAFSAAGIKNKLVAIFDNDTAAAESIRLLKKLPIAENIRVITLPRLNLLKMYPTIGPQGEHKMDVNGLAGSIELYFEDSSLKENGCYIPVAWKGYNEGEKQYQGEILKKKEVQSRYEKTLNKIDESGDIEGYDFSSMKKVLWEIFGFVPICERI